MFVITLLLMSAVPTFAADLACDVAARPERYSAAVPVPAELKKAVATYRTHWKFLCGGKKDISLSALLEEAEIIERAFYRAIPKVYERAAQLKQHKKKTTRLYEQAHLALSKTYPSFIPGFEGSFKNQEYFRVNLQSFLEQRTRGNREDQKFLAEFPSLLKSSKYPWLKQTSTEGGCVRFGEYDWVDTLKKVKSLRNTAQSKPYKKLLHRFEMNLFDTLSSSLGPKGSTYPICSCAKEKQVVSRDLKNIFDYLESSSAGRSARVIKKVLDDVGSKKISVRSLPKGECG